MFYGAYKINHENMETEHICCVIANNKDCQVLSKKAWLKERLDEGLVFLKGNVRGKCFIEYIPAEYAWAPIEADGYMYIDCLWVSGQFKGHGYSNDLLEECIRDSKEKGKKGLVILSSKKKMGYLSDPRFMKYKGFETVDTAAPYFELMCLSFEKDTEKPCFKASVKEAGQGSHIPDGFTLYYTSQCPFTAKYIPLYADIAKNRNVNLQSIHIDTREQAQSAPLQLQHSVCFIMVNLLRTKYNQRRNLKNSFLKKASNFYFLKHSDEVMLQVYLEEIAMYERMLNKQKVPTAADMASYCGKTAELFILLNQWLSENFSTVQEITFPYGNKYGWGIAPRKKKRLVCNIFAEKDALR